MPEATLTTTNQQQQDKQSPLTPQPSAAKSLEKPIPLPSSPITPKRPSTPSPESTPEPQKHPQPESDSSQSNDTAATDTINMETFQQILDLDEDGDHEFSEGMVRAYFDQAEATFEQMDAALKDKKLGELSKLGHFLKGSSAALGMWKVQASCEKIQHYGECRDEEADKDLSKPEALDKIAGLLPQVKQDNTAADEWLINYYESLKTTPNAEVRG